MTRINCIPPEELNNKHLLAEYHELPRIFGLAHQRTGVPEQYVLGKGHLLFFYNKLQFLENRYVQLVKELQSRGFKLQFPVPPKNPNIKLYNDWIPTENAMKVNRKRITERLKSQKISK